MILNKLVKYANKKTLEQRVYVLTGERRRGSETERVSEKAFPQRAQSYCNSFSSILPLLGF